MSPEDQNYDQGNDSYEGQADQTKHDDRYSKSNPSRNNEEGQQRRRGVIRDKGSRIKQRLRQRIDPRARFSRDGIRQQVREFRREIVKNVAKQAVKRAAMSPWFWIIMAALALIFLLIVIITGADEEENCNTTDGVTNSTTGPNVSLSPGQEPPNDYSRVQFGGVTLNNRTKIMLENANQIALKLGIFAPPTKGFTLTQGSYNKGGVAASAGTHDGGGAVDINIGGMTDDQINNAVKALRMAGFAAWRRGPPTFPPHIHAIAIGDTEASPMAKQQVIDYFGGKDGLAGHGPDNAPASVGRPFPEWAKKYANGATATGGSATGGGCEGQADGSGAVSKEYIAPSDNNCGGKYNTSSPIGKNFGDPKCSFSKDKLHDLLKQVDSSNAEKWFSKIAPCESQYNPNAFNAGAVDAAGAWGLYQMGSAKPPGSAPPAPGKNGPTDRGDVNWELQTANAAAYQKQAGWGYWACAK